MRLRGTGRLQLWLQHATAPFRRGAVVLLYHRVFEPRSDPQNLCVSPQHFSEQMEYIRKYLEPMSLQGLAQSFKDTQLPKRAVVVTFDDGYADNLHNAKALLERYEVPGTVFVTTGYVEQEREFWWDELDRLLLYPGTLPETLYLNLNGSNYQWQLREGRGYSAKDFDCYHDWHVGQDAPTTRQDLYQSLCGLLRVLPEDERRHALVELRMWAGEMPTRRPTYRAVSPDEILHLTEGGLVEVGAHTVNHPVLSLLPVVSQKSEIEQSKVYLQKILGRPVSSFAYPYGSRADYTRDSVGLVQEAGFACACSTFANKVGRNADPFQLPRILVRDWNGEEFARRLQSWVF